MEFKLSITKLKVETVTHEFAAFACIFFMLIFSVMCNFNTKQSNNSLVSILQLQTGFFLSLNNVVAVALYNSVF